MFSSAILSLTTGIRTEEARVLRWDQVDLDGDPDARLPVPPSIAVWRSVRLDGDTKTEKSRRTLALPQNAVTALREHRKWQAEARLSAGPLWQDTGLVFTTSVGTPLDASHVRRDFRALCAVVPRSPRLWRCRCGRAAPPSRTTGSSAGRGGGRARVPRIEDQVRWSARVLAPHRRTGAGRPGPHEGQVPRRRDRRSGGQRTLVPARPRAGTPDRFRDSRRDGYRRHRDASLVTGNPPGDHVRASLYCVSTASQPGAPAAPAGRRRSVSSPA